MLVVYLEKKYFDYDNISEKAQETLNVIMFIPTWHTDPL